MDMHYSSKDLMELDSCLGQQRNLGELLQASESLRHFREAVTDEAWAEGFVISPEEDWLAVLSTEVDLRIEQGRLRADAVPGWVQETE